MTKEELVGCLEAGTYSEPQLEGEERFSVKIGNETVNLSQYSSGDIVAFYCIRANVNKDVFTEIKRRALERAIDKAKMNVLSLQEALDTISE